MKSRYFPLLFLVFLATPTLCILDQTYFKALNISSSETNKETIKNAYTLAKEKLQAGTGKQKEIELVEEGNKVSTQLTRC